LYSFHGVHGDHRCFCPVSMVTTGACVPPGLLRLRPCEVCSFSDLGSRVGYSIPCLGSSVFVESAQLWRRLATDPECRDTGRLPVRSMLQVCSYLLTAPPILASKTVVTSFAWVSASIFLLGDSLSSMAMEEY
jgi:hypothetical protein